MGADVAVGTTQRFGIPLGFGGPHAAFFATHEAYKRLIPGRIIGVTVDADDNRALRMALTDKRTTYQKRKATSNICTAQALLAVMAGMYAVYHGGEGIKYIARQIHSLANILDQAFLKLGLEQENKAFFDTLRIKVSNADKLKILLKHKKSILTISIRIRSVLQSMKRPLMQISNKL